jgi:hypothetical protein
MYVTPVGVGWPPKHVEHARSPTYQTRSLVRNLTPERPGGVVFETLLPCTLKKPTPPTPPELRKV